MDEDYTLHGPFSGTVEEAEAQIRPLPEGELENRPPTLANRAKLLRLAAIGKNAREAASILGLGYTVVRNAYNDPSFRRQVYNLVEGAFSDVDNVFKEEQLSLSERMRRKSEAAFDVLCGIMDDTAEMPSLRAKVALEFLDRNPDTQPGHVVRHGGLTQPDQLALAARAAEEMNKVLPMRKKTA